MLGYDPQELAGRLSSSLLTDAPPNQDFRPTQATPPIEDADPEPCELHLRRKDGTALWVEAEIARYDPASDDALWFVVDITARKHADDTIRTTRTFLDRISSVAGVGGWHYDIESGVMTWSDETCRLHDLPPGHQPTLEETMGYFSRDGRIALVDALERAVDEHSSWDVEVPMTSARGRAFWARAVGILETEEGRPVRLIGTFQDVTKDRLAAEALRDTLRRLEVLFNSSPDSMTIARVTPGGGFVYETVNPIWERLFGIAAADAIGHPPSDIFPKHLAEVVSSNWQQCLTTREKVIFTFTAALDGKDRLWEDLLVPVFDGDRIDRMLAITRDVTDRAEIEAKLRRMQRMDAVGQLTAGIAHDFNNLLHTMMAALEMLRAGPPQTPDFEECTRVAHNAAQRAATLVHRLLAFSHKQPLTPVAVQPGELLGDLVGLLRTAVGRTITIETAIATDWCIRADRGQLENCIINLAVNARDAMPGGGALRLSVEPATHPHAPDAPGIDAPPGQYVRLTVEDDGPGMPPETLARATEPFFTTKPVGKGTGLGLSMVQGFAQQSGGDLTIRSAPGQGTAVSLWLPRADLSLHPDAEAVLGRKDSNLRMADSKSAALPLGDAPAPLFHYARPATFV